MKPILHLLLLCSASQAYAVQPIPVLELEIEDGAASVSVTWQKESLTGSGQEPLFFDYQLQASDDLGATEAWRDVGTLVRGGRGGSGGPLEQSIDLAGSAGRSFLRVSYRLRLPGEDLSGLDLSGVDFSNADLAGTDLSDADLSGSDFDGADLDGANFCGADLGGADFGDADVSGIMLTSLGGPVKRPVDDSIPSLSYTADDAAFAEEAEGRLASTTTLLVMPAAGVETQSINALLAVYSANIVGGIPGDSEKGERGMLIIRLAPATFAASRDALRASPEVEAATADRYLFPSALPRTGDFPDLEWVDWSATDADESGTWGYRLCRIPQLWNFNEFIVKRESAGGARGGVNIGLIDGGFNPQHEDLRGRLTLLDGAGEHYHGTGVSSVIGALHNGVGLDGVNPFARMFGVGREEVAGQINFTDGRIALGEFYTDLIRKFHPALGIKVVNISMGEGWRGRSGLTDPNITQPQRILEDAAIFQRLTASRPNSPLIVKSAGNDGIGSLWADGIIYAALTLAPETAFVVEAIDGHATGGARLVTDFFPGDEDDDPGSNFGGNISAPGIRVFAADITELNEAGNLVAADSYHITRGTSFAAPIVTGIISYLYSLEPSLTKAQVFDLIRANTKPAVDAAPHIDAFDSAMNIDRVLGEPRILRALLDIDDGTMDGNQRRMLLAKEDPMADPLSFDAEPFNKSDKNKLGDGKIDMADFRRFRDWNLVLQTPAGTPVPGREPGLIDHPKNDPNRNGTVSADPFFSSYPRCDFNGDGLGHAIPKKKAMRGYLEGQVLDDLGVFQSLSGGESLFADPETGYTYADLPDLIESSDLHISLHKFMLFNTTKEPNSKIYEVSVKVRARNTRKEQEFTLFVPQGTPQREPHFVITLPVSDDYRVTVCGSAGLAGHHGDQERITFDANPGGDLFFAPRAQPDETFCQPED